MLGKHRAKRDVEFAKTLLNADKIVDERGCLIRLTQQIEQCLNRWMRQKLVIFQFRDLGAKRIHIFHTPFGGRLTAQTFPFGLRLVPS